MTLEEAEEQVAQTLAWIDWRSWRQAPETICLDGHFSISQIEAILVLMQDDLDRGAQKTITSASFAS